MNKDQGKESMILSESEEREGSHLSSHTRLIQVLIPKDHHCPSTLFIPFLFPSLFLVCTVPWKGVNSLSLPGAGSGAREAAFTGRRAPPPPPCRPRARPAATPPAAQVS